MIDPNVHLRDWNQAHKETVEHGLDVAYRAGLDAVFEMPNTNPVLTSRKTIEDRIALGDTALENLQNKFGQKFYMFHGIYAGVTADPEQIKEVVEIYRENQRVVGLKMFAGHSTGNMGLVDDNTSKGYDKQLQVYKTLTKLDYKGVLAIHCERESDIDSTLFKSFDPITHTKARPSKAEINSIADQIKLKQETGYQGKTHICHISTPGSLALS